MITPEELQALAYIKDIWLLLWAIFWIILLAISFYICRWIWKSLILANIRSYIKFKL